MKVWKGAPGKELPGPAQGSGVASSGAAPGRIGDQGLQRRDEFDGALEVAAQAGVDLLDAAAQGLGIGVRIGRPDAPQLDDKGPLAGEFGIGSKRRQCGP